MDRTGRVRRYAASVRGRAVLIWLCAVYEAMVACEAPLDDERSTIDHAIPADRTAPEKLMVRLFAYMPVGARV